MEINAINNNPNFGLKIGPNIQGLLSTARSQAFRTDSKLKEKTLNNICTIIDANNNYRLNTQLVWDADKTDHFSYTICNNKHNRNCATEILRLNANTPAIDSVNQLAEAIKRFFNKQ